MKLRHNQLELSSVITSLKGAQYFVSLLTSIVFTKKYDMVNSDELIGNTEYLMLWKSVI